MAKRPAGAWSRSFGLLMALVLLVAGVLKIRAGGGPLLGSFDILAFRYLNRTTANPLCDAVMPPISIFEIYYVLLLVIIGVLLLRRKWRLAALFTLFFAVSFYAAAWAKGFAHLDRPYIEIADARTYDSKAGEFIIGGQSRDVTASSSFPSSHAWLSFYFAGFFWGTGWAGWLLAVLAALITSGRIYLGVHFPSDVLVGALCGWFLGRLARRLGEANGTMSES